MSRATSPLTHFLRQCSTRSMQCLHIKRMRSKRAHIILLVLATSTMRARASTRECAKIHAFPYVAAFWHEQGTCSDELTAAGQTNVPRGWGGSSISHAAIRGGPGGGGCWVYDGDLGICPTESKTPNKRIYISQTLLLGGVGCRACRHKVFNANPATMAWTQYTLSDSHL